MYMVDANLWSNYKGVFTLDVDGSFTIEEIKAECASSETNEMIQSSSECSANFGTY